MSSNLATVTLAALATALATGLGALPFLAFRHPTRAWVGLSSAAAAGFMLAAAVVLLWEGGAVSPVRTGLGALLGGVAMVLVRRTLRRHRNVHVGMLQGADATKAIVLVAVMTAHSFAEGVGVGVSYGGGEALGVFITIAIAVHNIPEGLAISLVLVPRGTRVATAAAWSVFSSLPQPLMAVPAFLFVETFSAVLPLGLGFAAGAMAWMVLGELVPDARAEARPGPAALAFGLAFGAMMGFQVALGGV